MPRFRLQLTFSLFVVILSSVAKSATLSGGYFLEHRAFESPVPATTGYSKFGFDVSISNGVALVGAPQEQGTGNAHLYNSYDGTLLHTFKPEKNDPFSSFGQVVAVEGAYAVVGSAKATYVYSVESYELLYTLPDSDAIDIDGERLIVSTQGAYNHIYDLRSGNRLASINSGADSVAISGDYAVLVFGGNYIHQGSTWVYDWKNERRLYELTPDDMPNSAAFGVSVAADGEIAVVGTMGDPRYSIGSAYVFDLATGETLHRLQGSPTYSQANFGSSVALHGDIALVGAYGQTGYFPDGSSGQLEFETHRGAVYAYSVRTGDEIARFTTSGPRTNGWANYGFSIDYDGRQLVAGTRGWPKKAYLTDLVIPEPHAAALISTAVVLILSRRPRRASVSA